MVPGDFEEHFYHSGKVDYDKFRAILSDNGLVPCQLLSDFLGDECVLKIGNVKIKLPPSGNEMDFCRVIYKYPVNKTVDWSEIYEEMTGDLSFERSESKKKKISDTARSLNRRVENNNFNALFSWQRKTVSRLY